MHALNKGSARVAELAHTMPRNSAQPLKQRRTKLHDAVSGIPPATQQREIAAALKMDKEQRVELKSKIDELSTEELERLFLYSAPRVGAVSRESVLIDATRATPRLPGLDIEIVHRRSPGGEAEQDSINLEAVPSFEAFGRFVESANPFAFWAQAVRMAWFSWLAAAQTMLPAGPTLLRVGSEGASRSADTPGESK
jgi:hypothetical protein